MRTTQPHPTAELVAEGGLRAVFQPIVDLASRSPVAYEALARGPVGTSLEYPDALFASARSAGMAVELDWACRGVAVTEALAADLRPPPALFVNADAASLVVPCPAHLEARWDQAIAELRLVVEVTERALTRDPAGLLQAVVQTRAAGIGIALDDVGAEPASLALMPFLEPDVIKLDLRLVQQRTSAEIAEVVNAVAAEAERTGATVLAEGIETEEHLRRAQAMGATLGQGWLFGRPGQLPPSPTPAPIARVVGSVGWGTSTSPPPLLATPMDAVPARLTTRRTTKRLLLPMSHHLENQALRAPEPPVLLAAFQHAQHFTHDSARRYLELTKHCSFVGALGVDLPASPVANVRGADLGVDHPLAGQWVVAVIGPHFSGALIARDVGDNGPDSERRFDFVITHDRAVVLAAARSLMQYISAN